MENENNEEVNQTAMLSSSATLLITNLVELEDCTRAQLIEKAVCMYAYIHKQISKDKHIFVVDKDRVIETEIVFIKPEDKNERWYNELIGG